MKETELKQCPFCGEEDIIVYDLDLFGVHKGITRWFARCRFCGGTIERKSKEEVINAWNRRIDSKQNEADKAYFTPQEVRQMTPAEVHKNYEAIKESMKKWG